jgi:hypothetical protein
MKSFIAIQNTLLPDIPGYIHFISKFTDSIYKISIHPKFLTSQFPFHFRMRFENLSCCQTFNIVIIWVGPILGILCINKCTWSLSTPISKNRNSYLLDISRQISFNFSLTALLNTNLRYFAGQIKWYSRTDILCDLCLYSLLLIHKFNIFAASGRKLTTKRWDSWWS